MIRAGNAGLISSIRGLMFVIGLAASALAETAAPPPNVILITLDTTRADRMGFLGSTRGLTPSLDALARESVVFTRAYAQAPLTTVSHASILTGTYPQFHQVLDFTYPLTKDLPYAPDILRTHGYETAAFLGSVALSPSASAPGFDRGFDTYDAPFHTEDAWRSRDHRVQRRGAEVVASALDWLRQHRLNQRQGPFFLWVHLFDAHDPYNPPEPYKTRYAAEPYDGGIAYEDSVVGELLQQLKARGLYEGTMIAVMADHGESLGAHGEDTHGIFLYDETIRVPLVIKLPREVAAGKRIENRVELLDVMPTMLQVARVEVPGNVQGVSLLALMKERVKKNGAADGWRDRPAYAQSDYPHIGYGWSSLQSLRTGKYLYIQAPRRELYDEAADSKAEHNLAIEMPAVADTVGSQLESLQQKTRGKREAPKMTQAPAAEEKLAALGYVVTTGAPKEGANGQEADPKDNIQIVQDIRRAKSLVQIRHFDAAIQVLQQLIAKNPEMPMVNIVLGDCYRAMEQYDKVVSALRQAVKLAPNSMMARIELGQALTRIQDFAAAVPEFEKVVATIPQSEQFRLELANAYAHTDHMPEAIQQYQKVLEAYPDSFTANLLLGQALVLSGDAASALPKLKKAVALHPEEPNPHALLAAAYVQLGQKTEAAREQAEALHLRGQ